MRTVTIERAPAELAGRTVADEMVRLPKVLPATLTVSGALEAFEDDHVHMLLLGDRGRLVGTLLRADLPARPSADPVLPYAVLAGRTVGARLPPRPPAGCWSRAGSDGWPSWTGTARCWACCA